MFPAKAHGPTVFDFNSAGVDAACCHLAKEGLPLFAGVPVVASPMNAIAQRNLCSINLQKSTTLPSLSNWKHRAKVCRLTAIESLKRISNAVVSNTGSSTCVAIIAIASVASFQSSSVDCSERDTPEANRLSSANDSAFRQEIFYVAVAQVESAVQPNSIGCAGTDGTYFGPVNLAVPF